jgi:hypothetical protein
MRTQLISKESLLATFGFAEPVRQVLVQLEAGVDLRSLAAG